MFPEEEEKIAIINGSLFDNETADANPPIEQVEIGGNLSKE